MTSTMQQMLDALMARAGGGKGTGSNSGTGGGAGGGGQDGYSVAGNDSAIPAYGPNRLNFSASQATLANGSSTPTQGKPGNGNTPILTNAMKAQDFRQNSNQAIVPDNIPAKYRDAVKRYFSTSDKPSQPEPQN